MRTFANILTLLVSQAIRLYIIKFSDWMFLGKDTKSPSFFDFGWFDGGKARYLK